MSTLSDYAPLDDISNRLAIPSIIFAILTPLFVIARTICGKRRWGTLWWDDGFLIFSSAINFPGTVLMIVASSWRFGKHESDLLTYPPERLSFGNGKLLIEKTLLLFWIDQILYQVVMGAFKISVLLWYIRIFETPNKKKFRWICWALAGLIGLFTVVSVGLTIGQCSPIDSAWRGHPVKCSINLKMYWDAGALFNVITYFPVTILPMPSICGISGIVDGLQIQSWKKKAGRYMLFGVGIFVCVGAIFRMRAIGLAALQSDRTWIAVDLCMWSIIEDNVGIICVCLPALVKPSKSWLKRIPGYTPANSRTSSTMLLLPAQSLAEKSDVTKSRSTTESPELSERQSV